MSHITTWSAGADEALTNWGIHQTSVNTSTGHSTPGTLPGNPALTIAPNPLQTQPEMTRAYSGGTLTVGGPQAGGVVEAGGVTRFTVSHDGVQGGAITSTLQRQGGVTTVELIPGNPASRTDIRTALREGLVTETRPGYFEDARQQAQQQPQQGTPQPVQQQPQQRQPADPGAEVFIASEDQSFARSVAHLPQHAFDASVASVTRAVTLGQDLGTAVRTLVTDTGMAPAAAQALVQAGHDHYERVVSRAVAPLGITGDRKAQFYEYARSNPSQLQDAVFQLTWGRNPRPFQAMARNFDAKHPAR